MSNKKPVSGQKRKARARLAKIIPIRSKREMASAAKRIPHVTQAAVMQQYNDKLAALEVDIFAMLSAREVTAADAARALVGVLMKVIHTHQLAYDEVIMTALINRQMLAMHDAGFVVPEDPEDAG